MPKEAPHSDNVNDKDIENNLLDNHPKHRDRIGAGFPWSQRFLRSLADHHSTDGKTTDGNATLADGNCAFNAFAQGLVRLILAGRTDLVVSFYAYVNSPHLAEDERKAITQGALALLVVTEEGVPALTEARIEQFCQALLNSSNDDQQRMLAPLLRHQAITAMANPLIYENMYRIGFEERLKLAYGSYLYRQSLQHQDGFKEAIHLIFTNYRASSGDVHAAQFLAWLQNEGYHQCLTYAGLCSHPERFHQWLNWLVQDKDNALDHIRHYVNKKPIEDSALLLHFPHISKKLETSPSLSEQAFLEWWEIEGKLDYFENMRIPASSPMDRHKWGSDDELAILALYYNLNVGLKKDYAYKSTIVGIAEGTIPESTLTMHIGDTDFQRLIQLGIVERITHVAHGEALSYVRFRPESLATLEAFTTAVPTGININALISQQEKFGNVMGKSVYQFLLQFNDMGKKLAQCLMSRGALNSATGNFITDAVQKADGTYIYPPDRERISRSLQNISPETLEYLSGMLKPITVDFTIYHRFNHWSCLHATHSKRDISTASTHVTKSIDPGLNHEHENCVTSDSKPSLASSSESTLQRKLSNNTSSNSKTSMTQSNFFKGDAKDRSSLIACDSKGVIEKRLKLKEAYKEPSLKKPRH